MPRATYSRMPPMCGHESDVVITAVTGAPANRCVASSMALAEYSDASGPSRITTPSSCLISTMFQLPGTSTTPGASSAAGRCGLPSGVSATRRRPARRWRTSAGTSKSAAAIDGFSFTCVIVTVPSVWPPVAYSQRRGYLMPPGSSVQTPRVTRCVTSPHGAQYMSYGRACVTSIAFGRSDGTLRIRRTRAPAYVNATT